MLVSDVSNADAHLHVDFYEYDRDPYKGQPFVRIMVPGDKTNVIDQPVRDHHKKRFPRQWLAYQMKDQIDTPLIGTPLEKWNAEQPDAFDEIQMREMQILKFQTVEQIATASDAQLQRVGMGAAGLRERARGYLTGKNTSQAAKDLEQTRKELDELKAQMAELLGQRKPLGRPRKEDVNVKYDAATGDAGHQ